MPKPNPIHIATFKKYIEYETNKDRLKKISELISFYQVYNSRLQGFQKSDAMSKSEHMIFDTIKLNALILGLFAFARPDDREKNPTLDNMGSSLNSLIDYKYHDPTRKYNEHIKMLESRLGEEQN